MARRNSEAEVTFVDVTEFVKPLKDLKKYANSEKLEIEMKSLLEFKDKYKSIKNLKGIKKLESLSNAILESSAYEERLVAIRIELSKCQRICNKQMRSAKKFILKQPGFLLKSKKDQDLFLQCNLANLITICEIISFKIEQVDMILQYIRNTSFNLKTILSTFKNLSDD